MQPISFREDILPLKDKLFRLAMRITLNRVEAEDIVQDALLKVWDKREEWQRWDSIEAYCITVTRNLSTDRIQKMENQTTQLPDGVEQLADSVNPYQQMVCSEQQSLIHELISRLPVNQRLIIQLRDIEGKSYKEIASLMAMTEEQIKVNLFRARQKIKQWFTEIDSYGL